MFWKTRRNIGWSIIVICLVVAIIGFININTGPYYSYISAIRNGRIGYKAMSETIKVSPALPLITTYAEKDGLFIKRGEPMYYFVSKEQKEGCKACILDTAKQVFRKKGFSWDEINLGGYWDDDSLYLSTPTISGTPRYDPETGEIVEKVIAINFGISYKNLLTICIMGIAVGAILILTDTDRKNRPQVEGKKD